MKKVLIIGSRGMLGQELVRVFGDDKKYEVVGWDIEDVDITNEADAREKISKFAPGIIINAAAYNALDKIEEDEQEYEKAKNLNGLAPGYLSRIAKNLDAIFVHYSTNYVFDGESKNGYEENILPNYPISKYAETKIIGESEAAKNNSNCYIIRLQWLFGKTAQSAGAKKSFFEVMLELAKTKNEFDKMVDEEFGRFTYAPDLACQTKYIIENKMPFGFYHITNAGPIVSWYGAAKILFDLAGRKDIKLTAVSANKYPRPCRRPKFAVLINTKLPSLRSWEEALDEFLRKY